jgi:hypothetical protein
VSGTLTTRKAADNVNWRTFARTTLVGEVSTIDVRDAERAL